MKIPSPNNFIEQTIYKDLSEKKVKSILTRFPPEPNGSLHIGSAKAICINWTTAEKYGGATNLRFDDTNPSKESEELAESIKTDIKWLGFKWKKLFYASDYYDKIYECAVDFIKQGLAYVCHMSADEISAARGTLTTVGKESPYRDRPIEESLRLFEEMKSGIHPDGSMVLRARIDMNSPNMNMRDPVIYRILHMSHFRTGDKWKIYPIYDFAHPIEDIVEGITHSLCSLEFEDHRPLYNWVVENCRLFPAKPIQMEFSKLIIDKSIIGKRYLNALVNNGCVDGWDDPRLHTLGGMRRRGYTPSSIREFCRRIGVSKSNSVVMPHILEACVREELNAGAMRVMAIIDPIEMDITNYNGTEKISISNNPTIKDARHHNVTFSSKLYIEREDFMTQPTAKFHRLKPDGIVRLMGGKIVRCDQVIEENGIVKKVLCSIINDDSIKPKGTIHWVSRMHCKPIKVRKFGPIAKDGNIDMDNVLDMFDKNSMIESDGYIEEYVSRISSSRQLQFIRMGYYIQDCKRSTKDNLIYNEIVSLKESK